MSVLGEVGRAAAVFEGAREDLIEQVRVAYEAGESYADIAEAAGVTRQTVSRWLASAGESSEVEVRPALDAALELLGAIANDANGASIRARVGHRNIWVQVIGVEMGLKSLDVPVSRLTDEERTVLSVGSLVAGRAKAIHAQSRFWPERVSLRFD